MPRLLCLVSALALAVGLPSRAAAEPLTVSSGRVVFTNEPGEFLLAGSGFSFLGSWIPRPVSGPGWSVCWPCQPGAIVDFGSSTYAYVNESIGAATINGVTYPALFFDAQLTFHGPRVVASAVHVYPWPSGSFTLTGRIAGFATEDLSGTPLFSVDLTGAGTAGVRFDALTVESRDSLYLTDVEYQFEDHAPTPEPSTVLLLATGLAVAATRRRGTRPPCGLRR